MGVAAGPRGFFKKDKTDEIGATLKSRSVPGGIPSFQGDGWLLGWGFCLGFLFGVSVCLFRVSVLGFGFRVSVWGFHGVG